jgi:hypothetical protein
MLFGVVAKKDAKGETTGEPDSIPGLAGVSTDQAILRLDSIIRDGIGPRIPGIHIRPIDGFPTGPVLLLRIPKSYAAPHMVTFKNLSRFFSRTSNGKYQLT